MFSFSKFIKKSGDLPGKAQGKSKDPLGTAKGAILKALDEQIGYIAMSEKGQPLPKSKSGTKSKSTWFTKNHEGYWTAIRYGQLSIPLNGQTGHFIGSADELGKFYEALKAAIRDGEMDTIIGDLQKKRSATLTGRTGKKKAA